MHHINEQHMVDAFLHKKRSFFTAITREKYTRTFTLSEFNSTFGIADIVIGSYQSNFKRSNARLPIDAEWVPLIMGWCKDNKCTINELAQHLGTTTQTIKGKVKKFINANLIKTLPHGEILVNGSYTQIIKTSIAVEAKIKDWKKALHQAKRYHKFANFSFVLLDCEHHAQAIKNIDLFINANIGLASIGNRVAIHHTPMRQTPPTGTPYYKLNEEAHLYFKKCLANS